MSDQLLLSRQTVPSALGVVTVVGYVTLLFWLADHSTYDVFGAAVVGPVLLVAGVLVLRRSTQRLGDPWLFQIGVVALVLKLVGAILRYTVVQELYHGHSDAAQYHREGIALGDAYRHLQFSVPLGRDTLTGTGFVMALTAVLYALTGPTLIGGYLAFAFMSFVGMWLSVLAFRLAVPEGNQRRYALLVLLIPTMVYWPSALGKDAWMVLWIGVGLYGAAHVFTGRAPRGLTYLALALLGSAMVRPHITLMLFAGFAAAVILRAPRRSTSLTPVIRIGGVLVLSVATVLLLRQAADYIGADSVSADAVAGAVGAANVQTEDGGSLFTPIPLSSPVGVPAAFLTVLFRPFPFEAHNVQALVASLEGLFVLWLAWCYRWSLLGAVVRFRRQPLVTMCLVYTVVFVIAFSGFANFGILSRQRSQVYVAFLALMCAPPVKRRDRALPTSLALPPPLVTSRSPSR